MQSDKKYTSGLLHNTNLEEKICEYERLCFYTLRFGTDGLTQKNMLCTYVKSTQHSQVERHELQGDDTEDALQTVHSMWQLNGLVCITGHFRVVLATDDDGPTLMERKKEKKSSMTYQIYFLCTFPHMS